MNLVLTTCTLSECLLAPITTHILKNFKINNIFSHIVVYIAKQCRIICILYHSKYITNQEKVRYVNMEE